MVGYNLEINYHFVLGFGIVGKDLETEMMFVYSLVGESCSCIIK